MKGAATQRRSGINAVLLGLRCRTTLPKIKLAFQQFHFIREGEARYFKSGRMTNCSSRADDVLVTVKTGVYSVETTNMRVTIAIASSQNCPDTNVRLYALLLFRPIVFLCALVRVFSSS